MKRYHLILAGLLALAASACTPQVDVEAEKNAIREMDREWENATNANGAEGWVSFVTEDAVLYPPNDPIVRGKEAIGDYMQPQFPPDSTVRWKPDHIEVSSAGDMAFMFGTYEIAVIGPESDPVSSTGKYGNAWTKMPDGTWKAVASVWNSDLPLPGADNTGEALVSQVLALIDQRNLDDAFELYALDYIYHGPGGQELRGRDGIRGLWEVFLVGFPDLHSTIEDMVSAGDKVVLRWRIDGTHTGEFLGIAPSNRKISLGVTEIFRFANGQLVEAWDQYDRLGLMQQIGAIPMPEEVSAE